MGAEGWHSRTNEPEKYLYGSILYEFKLGKIAFIKAREYEVIVVESHHVWSVSMKEYCTGHDFFYTSYFLYFSFSDENLFYNECIKYLFFVCAYKCSNLR